MEFKIIQKLVLKNDYIHTIKFLITNIRLLLHLNMQLKSSQTFKLAKKKKKNIFPWAI